MLLMYKDTPIFDINTEILLNNQFAPGPLNYKATKETFVKWMNNRRNPNADASCKNKNYDLQTGALNLTDHYWVVDEEVFEGKLPSYKEIDPRISANYRKGTNKWGIVADPTNYTRGSQYKDVSTGFFIFTHPGQSKVSAMIAAKRIVPRAVADFNVMRWDDQIGYAVSAQPTKDNMETLRDCYEVLESRVTDVYEAIRIFDSNMANEILLADIVTGNVTRLLEDVLVQREGNTGDIKSILPVSSFQTPLNINNAAAGTDIENLLRKVTQGVNYLEELDKILPDSLAFPYFNNLSRYLDIFK